MQLVAGFVLALGASFVVSLIIEAKRGPGAPDSTTLSMRIGGLIAPFILAAITGWKLWRLGPMLAASAIIAALHSGDPVSGLFAVIFASFIYFVASKARGAMQYYLPSEPSDTQDPPP